MSVCRSSDPAPEPASALPTSGRRPRLSPSAAVHLATDDAELADRVAGIAAAAGVALRTVPAADAAGGAPGALVLLGADAAAGYRQTAPPRRSVVVLALGPVPAQVWQDAVAVGAEDVVALPDAEAWLLDRLLDAAAPGPGGVVVAVVGGRGGAGASTLATALSVTAAEAGLAPVLIDLDPLGGGLDLVLGLTDAAGLRWEDLASARGRLQPGLLTAGLPAGHGVRLLTWHRLARSAVGPDAVSAVLDAASRDGDLVVLDLPRHAEDAIAEAALGAARDVLLIVPAEVRATAAAGSLLDVLEPVGARIRVVVRGPAPTGLTGEAVADALALPLAGELRAEPGLAAALDRGLAPPVRPRGPLARLCRALVAGIRADLRAA